MSNPKTSKTSFKSTCFVGELFGASPCDRPDGQTTGQCGQEVVPAQVFPQRAKDKGLQTLVTSGLIGHDSSASATLQQSLENKLVPRLDMDGSMLFKLTWKHKTTPLGRQYLERAASVLRTSDKDFTSWPTPCAEQANGEPEAFLERKRRAVMRGVQMGVALTDLNMVAKLSSWRSPNTRLNGGGDYSDPEKAARRLEQGHQLNLSEEVLISVWPTPQTHDDKLRGNTEANNHSFPHDLSNAAMLASWATPKVEDSECAGAHRGVADTLTAQSSLAAWASPSARDWKDTAGMETTGTNPDGSERSRLDQLPRQANLAGWHTPTANPATYTGGNAPGFLNLPGEVKLASWPTLNCPNGGRVQPDEVTMSQRNPDGTKAQAALENVAQLSGPVRLTVGGQVLTGSDAVMENSARCQGQLNPAHSAWLMGISPIWDIFCFRAGKALRSRRSLKKAKKE